MWFWILGKRTPKIPETHLKAGTDLFEKAKDTITIANNHHDNEILMFNDDNSSDKNLDAIDDTARLKKEEEMKLLVSKLEELQSTPIPLPEYKDAYKVNKI